MGYTSLYRVVAFVLGALGKNGECSTLILPYSLKYSYLCALKFE